MTLIKIILFFLCSSLLHPSWAMNYDDVDEYEHYNDRGRKGRKRNKAIKITPERDHSKQIPENLLEPTNLEQSWILSSQNATEKLLISIKQEQAKNDAEPLIFYISKHANNIQPLIKLGFKERSFKPSDIKWSIINKKNHEDIFNDLIATAFMNENKKNFLMELISEVSINQNNPKGMYNPHSCDEVRNIIVETIEANYLDIFEEFVKNRQNNTSLLNIMVVKRKERVLKEKGYFLNSYDYEEKEYSLLSWLMRSRDEKFHMYIDKQKKPRQNYINALKILLKHEMNKKEPYINGEVLGAFVLLNRQNDMPEGITLEIVVDKLNSLEGLIVEALPGEQKVLLEEILKKKGHYTEWQKSINSIKKEQN